jgi:hypothetical protein
LIDGGRPLPIRTYVGDKFLALEPFHGRCLPLVKDLKRRLLERRGAPPTPPPDTATIALGVVPRHLEGKRAELRRLLGGDDVVVLEEIDFARGREAALKARLTGIRLFVQPYDRRAVLSGFGYPPGGHLALQGELFEECRKAQLLASQARMIW